MSVNVKIFKVLYRLTLPGGLLLIFAAALIRVGLLADPMSPLVRFVPLGIYGAGLALSAYFRRSRLFFATLLLALAGVMVAWVTPFIPATSARTMETAINLVLPLNFVALAFIKERGIISRTGRRRLAIGAAQVIVIAVICLPWFSKLAGYLSRPFLPQPLVRWSHVSQPGLACFILSALVIMVPLIRGYRAVESSLFWALISSFVALQLGAGNYLSGIFFATGELAVLVALMETSYSMAYLDELTQLPAVAHSMRR